ncbi:hypothetical protein MTR_7g034615 [Medicago truncatula]|uniref:Uncharacterized protein n=1 Tax=Medicago truncatula TaxID=3880 RepID=A0A072U8R1_MEDTR|nr:hypothetical protein MTR_7g034615 [Medicago truncatula]
MGDMISIPIPTIPSDDLSSPSPSPQGKFPTNISPNGMVPTGIPHLWMFRNQFPALDHNPPSTSWPPLGASRNQGPSSNHHSQGKMKDAYEEAKNVEHEGTAKMEKQYHNPNSKSDYASQTETFESCLVRAGRRALVEGVLEVLLVMNKTELSSCKKLPRAQTERERYCSLLIIHFYLHCTHTLRQNHSLAWLWSFVLLGDLHALRQRQLGNIFQNMLQVSAFPICTISSNSDCSEISIIFPFARSSKNYAVFMVMEDYNE